MKRYKRLILLSIALPVLPWILPLTTAGGVVEGRVTSFHSHLVILKVLKTLIAFSSLDPFRVIFKGALIVV